MTPAGWALAGVAAFAVGLAKGGLSQVGMISVPLLALAMPPVQAAGILLPVYIVSDMGGLVAEYRPVLDKLARLMDDIGNYELPPERLANGDILIRRKAGAPPPPPLEQLPNFVPKGGGTQPPAQPGAPVVTAPDGSQIEL